MESFETTDFYLASFLRCIGFRLHDTRRDGSRFVFVFEDQPDRRKHMLAFYNNEGSIPPLSFVGAIKDMKSLMHTI